MTASRGSKRRKAPAWSSEAAAARCRSTAARPGATSRDLAAAAAEAGSAAACGAARRRRAACATSSPRPSTSPTSCATAPAGGRKCSTSCSTRPIAERLAAITAGDRGSRVRRRRLRSRADDGAAHAEAGSAFPDRACRPRRREPAPRRRCGGCSDLADAVRGRGGRFPAARCASAAASSTLPDPDDPGKGSGLDRARHGQARRARAQLLLRHRPDRVLRCRRAGDRRSARWRPSCFPRLARRLVRILQDRTERRLCLPHRPAAAARSRLDAARHPGRGGADSTTRAGARTGSAPP